MPIELLPGLENVLLFPIERRARPTLELLREIAPDVREVLAIAAGLGLAAPEPGLRERVDAETAEYILDQFGGAAANRLGCSMSCSSRWSRRRSLRAGRRTICRSMRRRRGRRCCGADGGAFGLDPLRERAEALTLRAAESLI